MQLTRDQRRRLVELLLLVSATSRFEGRTALLGDAARLALRRDEGSARLDLEGIVQQFDSLRADELTVMLIENAIPYVAGTAVARELEALLRVGKWYQPAAGEVLTWRTDAERSHGIHVPLLRRPVFWIGLVASLILVWLGAMAGVYILFGRDTGADEPARDPAPARPSDIVPRRGRP